MNDSKDSKSVPTTTQTIGGRQVQVPDYLLKDLGAKGLAEIAEKAKGVMPNGIQSLAEPTPFLFASSEKAPEADLLTMLNRPPQGPGLLVAGSGDAAKDDETFGIEAFDKKDLEKLVATDEAVKAQIEAPSTHRNVGTIAHIGNLGGRGATLGMRSMAAAAMAAIIAQQNAKPPEPSEEEAKERTVALRKRLTDAFRIKDRKKAKLWCRRLQKEDFGAIMLSRLFLPKGTFWYVKDDGTVTGENALRWMFQAMEKRDLGSIGKLLKAEVSITGHKGADHDMIGYSWSYELFTTLLGQVVWTLVENLPGTLVNFKDLTAAQILTVKEQAVDAALNTFEHGDKKVKGKIR